MKDWQDLDLAIFLRVKWQDLGQDPRSCHFFCVKMARSRARSMFKLYGDIENGSHIIEGGRMGVEPLPGKDGIARSGVFSYDNL